MPVIRHDVLADHRARLDRLDAAILPLLAERLTVCLDIADAKAAAGIAMMQSERVRLVLDRARKAADVHGVEAEFLTGVYERIIEQTCRAELHRMAPPGEAAP